MEEDIKVLENFCEVFRMTQRSMDKYEREDYGEIIGQDEIQAIENLIARNKKLEKCLDEDLGNIINLGILLSEHAEKPKNKNIYVDEAQAFLNTLDYYYISKSKVREKIEEYEELVKDFEEYWSKDPRQFKKEKCVDYYKIEALKELLQEGDK